MPRPAGTDPERPADHVLPYPRQHPSAIALLAQQLEERAPQAIGIDTEGVTNILEGQRGDPLPGNPHQCLVWEALAFPCVAAARAEEAVDGVLQDGKEQTHLP